MAITRIKNNQITDSTITNVKIAASTLTGDLMNPNLTFNSNLVLNGNLTVTGNVTAVQSTTTQVTDPLITLGAGNAGTSYDLGTVLTRGSGGNRFMGWKENEAAFVFINTTEDGTTTGNIATTAYSNVKLGNITIIGASTFGDITLSGNTVNARGGLVLSSAAGTVQVTNAAILSSTLSVVGAATVASLTSNAGIIATTGSFSSNLTGSALTVNNSATIGTTLGVTGAAIVYGGLQNTPIGNVTPSTALFTTAGASGNVTVSALSVNNTATIGSTLGVVGNINGTGLTLTGTATIRGSLDADGGLQSTPIGNAAPSTAIFTTVSVSSNATVNGLTVNTSAVVTNSVQALGGLQATPIGNAAASTGQFTTVSATGNITGAALTSNGSATVGTTLGVTGNATIGNVSTAALGASGIVTITNATDATGASSGALQVTGGASINKNLYVTGNIYAGNIIAIQANTLSVQDPLLYLTANTPYPYNYSIGFYSQYTGGNPGNTAGNIYQHTGFVRDNTDLTWKLFSNVVAEPGITVDFTNAQYDQVKVGNTIVAGTLSVSGGTTYTGNITVNGLTVNTSAVLGTTLRAQGGIQNTPIGNVTPSTALFTTAGASGNATVAALTVNGTATIGSTLGVVGNINGTGLTLSGSQVTTGSASALGGLQNTPIGNAAPSTALFTTATVSGLSQVNTLTVNTKANIGGDLTVIGNVYVGTGANASAFTNPIFIGIDSGAGYVQSAIVNTFGNASADFTAYANNGTDVQGWMDMGMTGNVFNDSKYTITGFNDGYIFANGVTGNSSLGGNLVVATGSGGATNDIVFATGGFTSNKEVMRFSNSAGALQIKTTTSSTGSTSGALVVTGGVGVQGTLNVQTAANLGNVTFNNVTISSNVTNTGLTINPNGTGTTTFNSGLNASKTVINGTNANTFVVSGQQVAVNIGTPTTGAVFTINGTDSMLLPVGGIGQRPGSPVAGMFRFTTATNNIEWYDGTAWQTASTNFTVVTANTQTGNGSATVFTLPVANASTAGTIVSINGVVQQPTSAYSITGANVTFTEAPSTTDVIDFRVFTTTSQITYISDIAGTTGLFYDLPTANSKITTFKTNGTESFSIQANSEARFSGNIIPFANGTANIGSSVRQFNTVFAKATSAQYADLAENYASDDVYPPGTVVMFGGVAEVTVAANATTKVAGVVSTNPAYLMNSAYEGSGKVVALALQGRVPCLVKGPVAKGDMMVSAGNGYARADANPKMGSVIGKSLENFNGTEGVIEVVVGRL